MKANISYQCFTDFRSMQCPRICSNGPGILTISLYSTRCLFWQLAMRQCSLVNYVNEKKGGFVKENWAFLRRIHCVDPDNLSSIDIVLHCALTLKAIFAIVWQMLVLRWQSYGCSAKGYIRFRDIRNLVWLCYMLPEFNAFNTAHHTLWNNILCDNNCKIIISDIYFPLLAPC